MQFMSAIIIHASTRSWDRRVVAKLGRFLSCCKGEAILKLLSLDREAGMCYMRGEQAFVH